MRKRTAAKKYVKEGGFLAMKYSISLVELWKSLRGQKTKDGAEVHVTSGTAEWDGQWPAPSDEVIDNAYFDLWKNGVIACLDGEVCECEFQPHKGTYLCKNADSTLIFNLTQKEFNVCTFN